MKIAVSDLIADFRTMLREKWAYGWGSAKRGEVDCAGAFAWAYKQHGASLYQGSNRMAREEVDRLIPIGEAIVAPGMAAFKRRAPGESGYALPASYQPGGSHLNGDLNDYYHVGLVDEDTARVLNAQSSATGFVASPISQGWSHVGYLKQVDYGAVETPREPAVTVTSSDTAVTVAASGSTVNLRRSASKTAALVERIPLGQTVTLRGPACGGWYPVRWGKKEGWVMAEFLELPEGGAQACSSWAVTFYDLTQAQAAGLQADNPQYPSRVEGRNG